MGARVNRITVGAHLRHDGRVDGRRSHEGAAGNLRGFDADQVEQGLRAQQVASR